ncbi:hypothetical protein EUBSIR_02766 [[Eubacterium] siraeum DSM 15702]|uniref:Uncharacterized protein n=1 Tax=[Eubacterium] siraeum DSM 15702 TaxID=428128 RepID=B0MSC6_9FIRM|nr:hypothetical protein EUBSIR_02766 [[Eubacterium] siraeum DSM 15702]
MTDYNLILSRLHYTGGFCNINKKILKICAYIHILLYFIFSADKT